MNINNGDVTIIIPTYCSTEESLVWLQECLDSALMQNCKVICYDDYSPERISVLKIFKHFIGFTTCYLGSSHQGVSNARNVLASLVKTELLFPLDCDDTLKDDCISELVKNWDGVPIYPDITKFGDINDNHYRLLDFSCDNVQKHIGIASVNVLHSLKQHQAIGGWDTKLDFFEDAEYNARLFGKYCGYHLSKPLVNYRIHANQRTKQYRPKLVEYTKIVMNMIRSIDMACPGCGKRRTASKLTSGTTSVVSTRGESVTVQIGVNSLNLPSTLDNLVLAQYIGGKGAGKHYYNGPVTGKRYKVKYLDYVYVDPKDARPLSAPNTSLLVLITEQKKEPVQEVQPEQVVMETVEELQAQNVPVPEIDVELVQDVESTEEEEELVDISDLTVKEITGMDIDPILAEQLIQDEINGKNRSGVIYALKQKAKM